MVLGLVDYGSDSDQSGDEAVSAPSTAKTVPKPVESKGDSSVLVDDIDNEIFGTGLSDNYEDNVVTEDALEDIVKPKQWELDLAEKEKKKLEKKARKQAKREKKAKKLEKSQVSKGKKKIEAFGALKAIDSDSDEEQVVDKSMPTSKPMASKTSGLLSMLPTPKEKGKISSSIDFSAPATKKQPASLIPASLRPKQAPKRKAESDDSDEEVTDFFGLSSAPQVKQPLLQSAVDSIPLVGSSGLDMAVGPSKPVYETGIPDEERYPEPEEDAPTSSYISNEQAVKLLAKDETIQFMERRSLTDIASNLVEVRVDDALGPNVNSTILKNLTKKQMVKDVHAPLPKDLASVDKNAKRKNQITYLANLAVAREEALQEQWADSKQSKRMSRQKYGF